MSRAHDEPWERLRAGDPAGLREVYAAHADAIFGFAFRRLASTDAAEDIVQATFTGVWRQARDGRLPALERDSARPLLLSMAHNECRNLVRSRQRRRALQERVAQLTIDPAAPDHAEDVSGRVDAERRMSEIHAALAALPARQRATIELVHWEGLSVADAARVLGVADGTVKSRLSRARATLGALLAPTSDQETQR